MKLAILGSWERNKGSISHRCWQTKMEDDSAFWCGLFFLTSMAKKQPDTEWIATIQKVLQEEK